MSYEGTVDDRGLALEAMEILSNSRINKSHRERLREIIRGLCLQLRETSTELRSLEMAGLNGRDRIKLARLQSLHGNIVNIQVCSECKGYFDSVLADMKYL